MVPHKFTRRVDDSRLEPTHRQAKPIKREHTSLEASIDSEEQGYKPTNGRINENEAFDDSSYTVSDDEVLQKP